jgi:hypothetical protein
MKAGVVILTALAWASGPRALAAAPEPACARISCSASGIAPELLKERTRQPARAVQRDSGGALPVDPWKHRLGGGPEQEDAQCLLEFGIGGTLDRKGTLKSHILGQGKTWPRE